jgi:uncharacterized protein involved in outer membrane biogenesis
MGRTKKIGLGVVVFFVVYTILGFLILPLIIKNVAVKKLSEALHRTVMIQDIKLNPYTLSLTINGLAVKERERSADFASFNSLYVNLQGVSIFKLAPVIKEFRIEGPYIKIVRDMDGGYNFSDLLSSTEPGDSTDAEKPADSSSGPFKFSLYNIQILNGSADILDQQKDKIHKISRLNLIIPFISNIGSNLEVFVKPHFSAVFNDEPILMVGKTKPFDESLETVFDIDLKGIDIPYYFTYLPYKTNLKIPSGSLDVNVSLSYIQSEDKAELSSSGVLALKDLEITDTSNHQLLKLALFQVNWLRSHILAKDIHVAKVELKSPEINITRDRTGMLNIHSLFPAPENEKTVSESEETAPLTLTIDQISIDGTRVSLSDSFLIQDAYATEQTDIFNLPSLSVMDSSVDTARKELSVGEISGKQGSLLIGRLKNGDLNIKALTGSRDPSETQSADIENEQPWLTTVAKLSINNFTIQGKGLASEQDGNLTLDEINFEGRDISTETNSQGKIDLSCKLNKTAGIETRGEFGINPVAADMQLEISDVNLTWFQPFLAGVLDIIISDGRFSTAGAVSLSQAEGKDLQAKYLGSAVVADFAVKENIQADDLVKWKQLLVNGIDIGIAPIYANIDEIALENLDSRIILNADGSLNLQNIIVSADTKTSPEASRSPETQSVLSPKTAAAKDTAAIPINIGKIICKDGKISFTDRSVSPSYSANLVDIQGSVSGLISEENQKADVSFQGKLDSYALLEITGTINPLVEDLFVDLKVRFKDLDLSPASPYSGKYVGYKIRKGKLSLDLSYLIDQKKLDSTNDIYIDQFDFGETVKSPDSLNLPVKLAVSLLKDRSGEISLHLPVTGRIDDPEFSIGGIILQMIKNILVKAATSPFSLIGAMVGSDEDLSQLEFNAGKADLADAHKAKLDTLVKALYERPNLQLEVSGFADMEKDREALISYRFNKQIKAQKFKKMDKNEAAAVSVDSVVIEPEEYEKYLKMAYKAGQFEKPKNILGFTKDIPVPEMEALILKNIEVTDDDLRTLANERAQAVKNYILGQGKIKPGRLFLVKPQSLTPEKVENLKDSRVELSLK